MQDSAVPVKILLLQMNALGDCLMTYPLLKELRRQNPASLITVACRKPATPLFSANPDCNEVVAIRADSFFSEMKDILKLREKRFGLLVDCTGLLKTACAAGIIGARESRGFDRIVSAGWLNVNMAGYYRQAFPFSETRYLPHLLKSLAGAGNTGRDAVDGVRSFRLGPAAQEEAARWYAGNGVPSGRAVLLAPGAKWAPRRWPEPYWADLCRLIRDGKRFVPVLIGSPDDGAMMERIARGASPAVPILRGASIPLLAAVMRDAAAVVCNDSFAMHLAACLNRPVAALFGPGDPERTAPRGANVSVLYSSEFCSPCAQYYSENRCWRGMNFCLRNLTPESVSAALDGFFKEAVI